MRAFLPALALAVAALAPPATAQCLGPDGLSGGCCAPVAPTLPTFPSQAHGGLGVCWTNCNPGPGVGVRVSLGAPAPTLCTQYAAPVSVIDGTTGATLLSGTVILDYTRTWNEIGGAGGATSQNYRFTAKADLTGTAGVFSACPTPSCLASFSTAFYYGYVDYSFDCGTGRWTGAIVLYHACDWFIHTPGFSDKPGVFHPGISYGIIAPSTPANPFVPGILPPPSGALIAEAVRDVVSPTGACIAEEPISAGSLSSLASICVCPIVPLPAQHTAQHFDGIGSCPDPVTGSPSTWVSLNTLPIGLPWLELMSTSLGSWTTGATYPGPEQVWVNEGPVFYHDSCAVVPGASLGNSYDILYGASTKGGYPILFDPTVPLLTDRMIDVASNTSLRLGAIPPPPYYGSVGKTDHLIYSNMP